jgi:protein gp37
MRSRWWDATWNTLGGCTPVSPGCRGCYAAMLAGGQQSAHNIPLHSGVTTKVRGVYAFTGKVNILPPGHKNWMWPMFWPGARHPVMGPGKPSLIFVSDMSDLFHEKVPTAVIDRVVATVASSNHIGLLLTKRPERMLEYFLKRERSRARWAPKLLLGFSAERQLEFNQRWPAMRELAKHGWSVFVSLAPMIGPIKLPPDFLALARWIIVSGEHRGTRERIRPLNSDWARAVRDQCRAAGIPFFMFQMAGERAIPRDLRIWEFPTLPWIAK